jgi:hypothetical protein
MPTFSSPTFSEPVLPLSPTTSYGSTGGEWLEHMEDSSHLPIIFPFGPVSVNRYGDNNILEYGL